MTGDATVRGEGGAGQKLSPTMLAVLASIANPHPDDEPFPPTNTVRALVKRGLIREVAIKKPADTFELLVGRHLMRLRITPKGRRALSASIAEPHPDCVHSDCKEMKS